MARKPPLDTAADTEARGRHNVTPVPCKSMFELIEEEAAARPIPERKLWMWSLGAILSGALPTIGLGARGPVLPHPGQPYAIDHVSLDAPGVGAHWRRAIDGDLRYVARGRALDYFGHRYGMVMLDSATFREWLNGVAAASKRRAGAKPTKRKAIADFVSGQYPKYIPSHVKYSTICDDFEKSEGGYKISDRTLRRALGKK